MESNLDIVRQNVIECTKCDLCKTRTNSVPGKGNFSSDVIFVGEAPGRNEDLRGEPFVGFAGKKLTLALENAGISPDGLKNAWKITGTNNFGVGVQQAVFRNTYAQTYENYSIFVKRGENGGQYDPLYFK